MSEIDKAMSEFKSPPEHQAEIHKTIMDTYTEEEISEYYLSFDLTYWPFDIWCES